MGLFESVYTSLLGVFALVGLVYVARWIFSRSWHWVFIALALIVILSGVTSSLKMAMGQPAQDLRIITELLATGGLILSVRALRGLRSMRQNQWVQYGAPAFAVIFIAMIWSEQIGHVVRGDYSLTQAIEHSASAPTTAPVTSSIHGIDCKDIPEMYRQGNCH